MKTNYLYILAPAFLIMCSCLRLDDNLFNPDNSIDKYLLDEYQGEVDFRLDSHFDIPEDKINLLTLNSGGSASSQSYKIHAVYIGEIGNIGTDTVIMYCHGNRDHLDFYWPRAKLLANVGGKNRFGVMMIDYRGYGLSEGKPSEQGLYDDVDAGLAWLKQNGLANERLVIYGFSMGSAPATEITANPDNFSMRPSRLILEAPFASAAVMVQDGARLAIPAGYLVDLEIDNAEEIKKVEQPFLWIHGMADGFLSIRTHGEVVYKNHNGIRKEAIRVPSADHDEVPKKMGFSKYIDAIERFITE